MEPTKQELAGVHRQAAARTRPAPVPTIESAPKPTPGGHMADENPSMGTSILSWLAVIALLYLLVCAVGVIGDGFKALGKDTAEGLFEFATNPFIALFVGILMTAIVQSSSTTTSIIVVAVGAGAMPIAVGIPMIMGANAGTSVTNTLASLGHIGNKKEFRLAFTSATVHDFFNLLAILILLPLELMTGYLEKFSGWLVERLNGIYAPDPDGVDFVSAATDPVVDVLTAVPLALPGVLGPVLTVVMGVAMIFLVVRYLGKVLQVVMVGTAREILHAAVGKNAFVAFIAGTVVTFLVQSSSVTTSMMVPFAGSGSLTPRQIYPMTLGANVGTTVTALFAALALTGTDGANVALQIALVHVLFNLSGIVAIYFPPFMRNLPLILAEKLAIVATQRKMIAVAYVVGVFLAIPGIFVGISALTRFA